MPSFSTKVLSAVAIAAALGLGACSDEPEQARPAASATTPAPLEKPPTPTAPFGPEPSTVPPADIAPLPAPEALTDVMVRIADPAVPGGDKLNLVQHATPADAEALDRFGRALADGGYTPLTFEAHELVWSAENRGNVLANIVVKTANPQTGEFAFPMEFSPTDTGSWQLTRETADMLLQLGQPAPTPPG
ncbi:hypothetical protein [Mycobacterium deserti]|uniref:Low molecular weight antigen MTB12-like C-terminal domain-containing protein n=1 Tax=Mycobacterium deserti TaxID=2978347 RepID=A0ABT2MCV7_9MYCO|nr:hypothetical protein [Mycobacterium deserti]MCT7660103.1 hypothetical protein [Mycobacterium deserti]